MGLQGSPTANPGVADSHKAIVEGSSPAYIVDLNNWPTTSEGGMEQQGVGADGRRSGQFGERIPVYAIGGSLFNLYCKIIVKPAKTINNPVSTCARRTVSLKAWRADQVVHVQCRPERQRSLAESSSVTLLELIPALGDGSR